MKKIPTLFRRVYSNHEIVDILNEITPGCEDAFFKGMATLKVDGSCCAVINGEFYKRYDCKKGKIPPEGAIPCCDAYPVTGHWPHWVKVDPENPADKWFYSAYLNSSFINLPEGTYEACGPHFQGNPYNLETDSLFRHGEIIIDVKRTFEDVKEYLEGHEIEGIVFWLNDEPVCKIKRTDFGLPWNRSNCKRK